MVFLSFPVRRRPMPTSKLTTRLMPCRNSETLHLCSKCRNINGETNSPASGKVCVNMTNEDGTFHVGRIPMSYETTIKSDNCTTTYTISGDGFWDIFWGEDKKGPNGELGGTPYSYESFSWSETYKNPGYGISSDGKPTKIENGSKNEKQ